MSDKKEEEPQQQHIQTEPQDDEQEEKKGSGGLLSTIGDPIGTSSASLNTHTTIPFLTCTQETS